MRRSGRVRGFIAIVALGCALGVIAPSQATTIPVPRGVVVGQESDKTTCDDYHCTISTTFKNIRIVGGLRGMTVVASATYMHFVSFQYYCDYACPPTTPVLAHPFTISGSTASGAAFSATCSTGSIQTAFPEEDINVPMVQTRCSGGTAASSGPFGFKFLHLTSGTPFVDLLVEA